MNDPDLILWDEVSSALEPHIREDMGDRTWQDVLNRQAVKMSDLLERSKEVSLSLNPSTCAVRLAPVKIDELSLLGEPRPPKEPFESREPIVVFEYDGRSIVVDGNSRVRRWLAQQDETARHAIILRLRKV